ncbi:MAG: hypothetical protein ACK6B2_08865 [Planctomycetota bacterium]
MSSNFHPPALSGVVTFQGIPVGGLAIPEENTQEFIVEFQRQYQSLGLAAHLLPGCKLLNRLPILPNPQKPQDPHDPDS